MAEQIVPPFSARNRGAQAQIDNACPDTSRMGLLHVLHDLVDKQWAGWQEIVGELKRIARDVPGNESQPGQVAAELMSTLPWDKVFDFCERLYNHLAREVSYYNSQTEEHVITATRSDVQGYIASELQRLFLEENLAFEFSDGLVRRRGRRHTAAQVAAADLVL